MLKLSAQFCFLLSQQEAEPCGLTQQVAIDHAQQSLQGAFLVEAKHDAQSSQEAKNWTSFTPRFLHLKIFQTGSFTGIKLNSSQQLSCFSLSNIPICNYEIQKT